MLRSGSFSRKLHVLSDAAAVSDGARALQHAGDLDGAVRELRESLQLFVSVHGESHEDVASVLDSLGCIHQQLGSFAAAQVLHQRALNIWRDVVGDWEPSVAACLSELGACLQQQGALPEAQKALEDAVAVWLVAPEESERHPGFARCLDTLGVVLRQQGELLAAEKMIAYAVRLKRALHGRRHPEVAASLNHLASVLREVGEFATAEQLLKEALSIYDAAYGQADPHVAQTLNNLALVHQQFRQYDSAEELFRRALALMQAAQEAQQAQAAQDASCSVSSSSASDAAPAGRPAAATQPAAIAVTMQNLALVLWQVGKAGEARRVHEEALGLLRAQHSGRPHPEVAACLGSLARALRAQGKLREARAMQQAALDMLVACEGPSSEGGGGSAAQAQALNALGAILREAGELDEAGSLHDRALLSYVKLHGGKGHPNVGATLSLRAAVELERYDLDAAEALYRQSLAVYRGVYGEGAEHIDVAAAMSSVGVVQHLRGQLEQAQETLYNSVARYKLACRSECYSHPAIAVALQHLALVLSELGDARAAEQYMWEALEVAMNAHGDRHPHVHEILQYINTICQKKPSSECGSGGGSSAAGGSSSAGSASDSDS